MNLGNLLGQILQQGMAGQGRSRLEHAAGPGGIGDLLGAVLGGQTGATSGRAGGGGLGDLLGAALGGGRGAGGAGLDDLLGGMLGQRSAAPAAGAGAGGLGDLLGGLLGGGRSASGAQGQGSSAAMGLLATIALAAFKNWSTKRASMAGLTAGDVSAQELSSMTAPDTEALILRAMMSAAKADGEVDEAEIQRIVGKLSDDGVSAEEKRFLMDELRRPLDLQGLIAEVPNPLVGAEVYAASLLAIDIDTPAEVAYLRQLAQRLGLDPDTVSRLHQITGATPV
ncbi:tellurite resistance TerB family protein [Thauera sp. WH-1]|uniref:tellurite resistance TerB family protein n=1 Tax=Thauera sp. WH-1 TaxID=3398230 RepID=UPI0039FD8481